MTHFPIACGTDKQRGVRFRYAKEIIIHSYIILFLFIFLLLGCKKIFYLIDKIWHKIQSQEVRVCDFSSSHLVL